MPGFNLWALLEQSNDPLARRSWSHRITCGGDDQFHTSKGLIGVQVAFADQVGLHTRSTRGRGGKGQALVQVLQTFDRSYD
jgi:hypothetical protein